MRTVRSSALLLVAFAAIALPPQSPAETGPGATRTAVVSYADLNLSAASGTQALYRRIQLAAHAVCRAADFDFDLEGRRSQRECARNAVAGAVERIDNASLTDLHRSATAKANRLW